MSKLHRRPLAGLQQECDRLLKADWSYPGKDVQILLNERLRRLEEGAVVKSEAQWAPVVHESTCEIRTNPDGWGCTCGADERPRSRQHAGMDDDDS